MQEAKNRGPLDPTTPGLEGQALGFFVSPTSAFVTSKRDFCFFMIIAFVEEEMVCFAFYILHKSVVPSGYTSPQRAHLKSYEVA